MQAYLRHILVLQSSQPWLLAGWLLSILFGTYWADSVRQIPNNGDLSAYWRGISSKGDFLGSVPSYTAIRDPMLRLCHRLIACSIAGRSQAPEKVTSTDLLYLQGMLVGSVNIPYLLARYLRRFASGRKRGAMIYRGQFVARLAEHFRLLTEQRLQGLTVAPRLERQLVAMVGGPEVAKGALDVDEGAQAVPAPVQAPQAPLAAVSTSTMAHRLSRLEEEVHNLRGDMGEQREVLDSMARDFSRVTTWTVTSLSLMMDRNGVRHTSYADTHVSSYGDLAGKKSTMLVKYP
ncbi:hypothetical protein Tco_0706960 [Tanacetum coccineum]|uniref:Uncharacterized protein n=1 Tax=Tanacetum coccineum TaxID=301880 RepID=A0ABQ4Y8V5_9ASTR